MYSVTVEHFGRKHKEKSKSREYCTNVVRRNAKCVQDGGGDHRDQELTMYKCTSYCHI